MKKLTFKQKQQNSGNLLPRSVWWVVPVISRGLSCYYNGCFFGWPCKKTGAFSLHHPPSSSAWSLWQHSWYPKKLEQQQQQQQQHRFQQHSIFSRAKSISQKRYLFGPGTHSRQSSSTSLLLLWTVQDELYLQQAVQYASRGRGHTYPNPAVGCVLVRQIVSPSPPIPHQQQQQQQQQEQQQEQEQDSTSCQPSDDVVTTEQDWNAAHDKMMIPVSTVDGGNSSTLMDGDVIGVGYHPRAGYPHAEIFALLQAFGYVSNGVEAADAVIGMQTTTRTTATATTTTTTMSPQQQQRGLDPQLQELIDLYASSPSEDGGGGPQQLFGKGLRNHSRQLDVEDPSVPITTLFTTTAYVTLEPCCHYGRTPPCAASLVLAGVDRVVVGFRDPNPRVDGGGVLFLQQAGIRVDLVPVESPLYQACANLVREFVKRITPRDDDDDQLNYARYNMTGAKRAALRSLANRLKNQGQLASVEWSSSNVPAAVAAAAAAILVNSKDNSSNDNDINQDNNTAEAWIAAIELKPEWMEHVDSILWNKELVLLRLNKAANKKKHIQMLGKRIAESLQAHVVQSVGHTILLYRPDVPPVLNLDELIIQQQQGKGPGID